LKAHHSVNTYKAKCPDLDQIGLQDHSLKPKLKAKANKQATLTPIIMSTHSPKTQNKNTTQLN